MKLASETTGGAALRIGGRTIGPDKPVLVVAEIGVNHDGSAGRALDLVRFAQRAGADAVKLQVFKTATLLHASSMPAEYQRQRTNQDSAAAMLAKYELSDDDIQRVVAAIRAANMLPLATPFSVPDVQTIERLDLPAIKIASPDLVNRPLLEAAAKANRPLLVSTGAATIEEVETATGWLSGLRARFMLMHCVSSYPTKSADANLCWIGELSDRFGVAAGFSDHTSDLMNGALATAAGAVVIEKHLTYDKSATGPDHAASASPTDFAKYVAGIRAAEVARGKPGKQVLDCERDVRRVARQSLVALRNLDAGALLTRDDLTVQRPGIGVPAAEVARVVGRKLKRTIAAGTMLQWDMLADAA
jgi:N-acetylneuraminate synthase/N,N'-diacetyllegionaminate synthase